MLGWPFLLSRLALSVHGTRFSREAGTLHPPQGMKVLHGTSDEPVRNTLESRGRVIVPACWGQPVNTLAASLAGGCSSHSNDSGSHQSVRTRLRCARAAIPVFIPSTRRQ